MIKVIVVIVLLFILVDIWSMCILTARSDKQMDELIKEMREGEKDEID